MDFRVFQKIFRKINGFIEIIAIYKNWPTYILYKFKLIPNNKPIKLCLRNGISFNISERNNFETIDEVWRNRIQTKELSLPSSGIVIDIGANIGAFSLMAAEQLHEGLVLSYEPEVNNYSALVKNIAYNKLENKVKPIQLAVSDKVGEQFLFLGEASGYHSISPSESTNAFDETEREMVKTTTLSELFRENKISNCAFLKMDCEVAEKSILLNADLNDLKKISKIVIECHNGYSEIIQRLKGAGFKISTTIHTDKTGVVYATRI